MKKTLGLLLSLSLSTVMAADWTYLGEHGSNNWADLDPKYSACNGKSQSPINLNNFIEADLADLKFDYKAGGHEFLNNGHTTQVKYQAGSGIEVDGTHYELKQFHFHSPSENHINGQAFPMEMHLVHGSADGKFAVVALMFSPGDKNPLIETLWQQMPQKSGDKISLEKAINIANVLPANRDYYRFKGSLTTPPCSEGLTWLVLKNPAPMSLPQWQYFSNTIGSPNNRPIQARNNRIVQQ